MSKFKKYIATFEFETITTYGQGDTFKEAANNLVLELGDEIVIEMDDGYVNVPIYTCVSGRNIANNHFSYDIAESLFDSLEVSESCGDILYHTGRKELNEGIKELIADHFEEHLKDHFEITEEVGHWPIYLSDLEKGDSSL